MTVFAWPQWLGAGTRGRGIERGNTNLVTALGLSVDVALSTASPDEPAIERGIVGRAALLAAMQRASEQFAITDHILLLGGDCSIDLSLIANANRRSHGQLKVIYFDAHADINIPIESPSGALHGMVLGHLLGLGDREILSVLDGPMHQSQFQYRGVRVHDEYERKQIALLDIDTQPIDGSVPDGDIFLHIDLDVLDPTSFPFTTWPTDNGPSIDQLALAVKTLTETGRVIGIAVTECAAPTVSDAQLLEPLLNVLRTWHRQH
jgi:arginase